eukprot:m.121699 g.121699  ORF g.121699 m.121699 type:complete len:164 (+) comp13391_c0_seq2:1206-1697(+)
MTSAGSPGQSLSLGLIVASGMLWAIEVLAWRKAAALGLSMFAMTAWTAAAMGLTSVFMLSYSNVKSETTTKTTTLDTQPATGTREAIGFCAFAGVSWIAACLCFNTGLAGMSSAGVANGISVVVQTLAIFVASWFLFGESINDLKQIAGITLMMFGMVLVNWK